MRTFHNGTCLNAKAFLTSSTFESHTVIRTIDFIVLAVRADWFFHSSLFV